MILGALPAFAGCWASFPPVSAPGAAAASRADGCLSGRGPHLSHADGATAGCAAAAASPSRPRRAQCRSGFQAGRAVPRSLRPVTESTRYRAAIGLRRRSAPRRRARSARRGAPEASRPAPSSTARARGACRAQRSTRQPAHSLAVPLLWGAMSAAMGEHARNGASTTGRRHGGTAARRRRERPTVYFRRVALYSVYRVTPGTGDHPRGALDPCALIRGGDPRDVWSGVAPRRPVAVHPCGVRRQLAVTMAITPRVPMGRLPRAAPPSGPANPEAVHAF